MTMTARDRLEAFWAGERPDRCPYTVYKYLLNVAGVLDDPALAKLVDKGLIVTESLSPFDIEWPGVEMGVDDYEENGEQMRRETWKTEVGSITQTFANGWHSKYWLETAEDYKVLTWIMEHAKVVSNLDHCSGMIAKMGEHELPTISCGRTPLQKILVDYAGLEAFAFHLIDMEPEVRELYAAILGMFEKRVELAARAPATYVGIGENFTSESLGPARYEEFILPVYEKYVPQLHAAGKVVGVHYDGRTSCCADQIGRAPFDLLESFTEPPEGDMLCDEARAAWPEKLFWSNIQVSDYQLPPDKLRTRVLDLWEKGAVSGRQLAFEVSEDLPSNWDESMGTVLDALAETEA